MYRYTCVFNFCNEVRIYVGGKREYQLHGRPIAVSTEKDGIHAFREGFWINDKLKLTKFSDCRYWIPPSQILYVEKQEIARKDGT